MLHLKARHWPYYKLLMRTDKPIGSLLLLWPTFWALWLANNGAPDFNLLIIFSLGVFIMRSAGCVINDYADRKIDGHVKRTQQRPLAAGLVTPVEALQLFAALIIVAFCLVLFLNWQTVYISIGGLLLASAYPFMKRYTHFPQVVLGAAFSWSMPMAYMASQNSLPAELWWLYLANLLWTVAYDTKYAMVDREDDLKIGVKSTAVLFAQFDKLIIGLLQLFTLAILIGLGLERHMSIWFYAGLTVAAGLFIYQQILIRHRQPDGCFKAFLNNHYVGLVIFAGIALDFMLAH